MRTMVKYLLICERDLRQRLRKRLPQLRFVSARNNVCYGTATVKAFDGSLSIPALSTLATR